MYVPMSRRQLVPSLPMNFNLHGGRHASPSIMAVTTFLPILSLGRVNSDKVGLHCSGGLYAHALIPFFLFDLPAAGGRQRANPGVQVQPAAHHYGKGTRL